MNSTHQLEGPLRCQAFALPQYGGGARGINAKFSVFLNKLVHRSPRAPCQLMKATQQTAVLTTNTRRACFTFQRPGGWHFLHALD